MPTEQANFIQQNGNRKNAQGRSWAWGITGFYLFFVAATLSFVAFAVSQHVDLVSIDYYQNEIEHQQHIDKVRRTTSLPADMKWSLRQEADELVCHFPADQQAGPLSGQIHLYRPSDARLDRQWPIALDPHGNQRLSLDQLDTGMWTVKISWSNGAAEYYSEQSFALKR